MRLLIPAVFPFEIVRDCKYLSRPLYAGLNYITAAQNNTLYNELSRSRRRDLLNIPSDNRTPNLNMREIFDSPPGLKFLGWGVAAAAAPDDRRDLQNKKIYVPQRGESKADYTKTHHSIYKEGENQIAGKSNSGTFCLFALGEFHEWLMEMKVQLP